MRVYWLRGGVAVQDLTKAVVVDVHQVWLRTPLGPRNQGLDVRQEAGGISGSSWRPCGHKEHQKNLFHIRKWKAADVWTHYDPVEGVTAPQQTADTMANLSLALAGTSYWSNKYATKETLNNDAI